MSCGRSDHLGRARLPRARSASTAPPAAQVRVKKHPHHRRRERSGRAVHRGDVPPAARPARIHARPPRGVASAVCDARPASARHRRFVTRGRERAPLASILSGREWQDGCCRDRARARLRSRRLQSPLHATRPAQTNSRPYPALRLPARAPRGSRSGQPTMRSSSSSSRTASSDAPTRPRTETPAACTVSGSPDTSGCHQ